MGVLFNNIPGNVRVPFFYAEFQPGGTPYQANARLLLVGQKLAAGSAAANQPILASDHNYQALAGPNSMLAQMYAAARRNAPIQEIWMLPLADDAAGVLATGKLTVATVSITQTQALTVYIAGRRVRIPVLTSDTRAQIATALAAAINAAADMPVTAAVNGTNNYEVDITARHKGTLGNAILLEVGTVADDGPYSATAVTVTAMANGATDPDLAAGFANLGDMEFDWIAGPYADASSIGDATDLLNDISGRWAWSKQIYGHYIGVHTGTVGALQTLGMTLNSQHVSIFPARKFLSTPWEVAGALGAVAASHLQDAPELSRPLQTLVLNGIKGPRLISDRLNLSDRQTLYFAGISGYHVRRDGQVAIDRVVTTYRTNAWGDADWTYLDIETMAQSMYGIRYIRTDVTSKHGRQALANDNPGNVAGIVTPQEIRATVIHAYTKLVTVEGVFENIPAFVDSLVVERDGTDPNRINVGLKLDHVNQLRVLAAAAVNYMQLEPQRLAA